MRADCSGARLAGEQMLDERGALHMPAPAIGHHTKGTIINKLAICENIESLLYSVARLIGLCFCFACWCATTPSARTLLAAQHENSGIILMLTVQLLTVTYRLPQRTLEQAEGTLPRIRSRLLPASLLHKNEYLSASWGYGASLFHIGAAGEINRDAVVSRCDRWLFALLWRQHVTACDNACVLL